MNKDFETLEKIAIHMIDSVWDYNHEAKVGKLEEEFAELMEQFTIETPIKDKLPEVSILCPLGIDHLKAKDEMADVLFVLLQISNKLGYTASDLIHHATLKLYKRIADPNYNK